MTGFSRRRWRYLTGACAAAVLAVPAFAQSAAPPYRNLDANGVDLTDGSFNFNLLEGRIGSGPGEMRLISYEDGASNWPSYYLTQNMAGSTYTIVVSLGDVSDKFVGTTNSLVSSYATGATLTRTGGTYVYRYPDGTKIEFINAFFISGPSNMCSSYTQTDCQVLASAITRGDGLKTSYAWTINRNCQPIIGGNCTFSRRLSKISNNAGYGIELTFVGNSVPPQTNPPPAWFQRATAQFVNANQGSSPWPTATYSYPSSTVRTVTTPGGKLWRMTSSAGKLVGIKRPGAANDTTTISYGTNGVTSVVKDGVTTTYNRTLSGNTATMVVTDALSNQTTIVSDMVRYRSTAVTDPLGRTTSTAYDSLGRPTEVTAPEVNKVQYAYDGRGNVTTATVKAKPAFGLADIVTTAGFDATCANVLTCNSPNWTKDAKGAQTDYTYAAATGQLLTATSPAPAIGATRPQARYGYTAISGITMPTSVSQCQTGATCAGTADEVKTTVGYNANLLPVSLASGAGDGSLTATTTASYDPVGNLLTVDGPLAGTADTTTLRWSLDRERVGVISPDPDGVGSLKRRAAKTTYNADGQATLVEIGTVTGTTDPDWAAFVSLEAVEIGYDANARPATSKLVAGGTAYALTQTSYDAIGRPDCTASRMNPAIYGSLPASACTLGTAGSFGPDRISMAIYDAAGQVTQNQVAIGTADTATEATLTYTSNGKLKTLKDGENNLTTYEYDGHDRLSKTRMPLPTQCANASSTTDYEQLGYDAASNITSRRLRDATTIAFAYDNLDRPTLKDLPGSEPDVTYAFDNLGRLTSASQTGNSLSFSYDALSRNLTQVGPQGTVASQWDLAGRRTRLTYPGSGLYIDYDYLVTGEMTKLRENGATTGIGVLATLAYDDLGRRTGLTFGNGAAQAYTYDPVSRLASLTNDLASTANDLSQTFAYNPASQIASAVRTGDAYAWTGHFNQNATGTPNGLNQLTQVGTKGLTHDARGNVTAFGPKSFTFSSENLLQTGPNGTTLSYDPAMRLAQIASGGTTKLAYDGLDRIAEYDGSNALQRRYVHGPSIDEPLVWYEGSGTTDRRFLSSDERGSIISVTDGSGVVLGLNKYDEFGNPQSTNLGVWGYTGQAWLPTVGIWYYKARDYDPDLGRFLQTDPIDILGGINLYAYVGNDPINWIDPLGLVPAVCVGVTAEGCALIVVTGPGSRVGGGSAGGASGGGPGTGKSRKPGFNMNPRGDGRANARPQNVNACPPGYDAADLAADASNVSLALEGSAIVLGVGAIAASPTGVGGGVLGLGAAGAAVGSKVASAVSIGAYGYDYLTTGRTSSLVRAGTGALSLVTAGIATTITSNVMRRGRMFKDLSAPQRARRDVASAAYGSAAGATENLLPGSGC